MDVQEMLARFENLTGLSAEELTELEAAAVARFDEIEAAEQTSETIEALTQAADIIEAARAEVARREAETAELAVKAQELSARIHGEKTAEDAGDNSDAGEDDKTEEPAVEAEKSETVETVEVEETRELVAASTSPKRTPLETIGPLRSARSVPPAPARRNRMVAAADIPGKSAGAELDGMGGIAEAFSSRLRGLKGVKAGRNGEKFYVASILGDYPEERKLSSKNTAEANTELIKAATGPDALVAAGGLCAPVNPYYDVAQISDDARPVAAALAQFQASRGGIRFVPPPVLADITSDASGAAITVQTEAEDIAGVAKTCQTVVCDTEQEVVVAAVVSCLQFGNMMNLAYPERIEAYVELAAARHARVAETRLLTIIEAGSNTLNMDQVSGAASDLVGGLARAARQYRYIHRMSEQAVLQAIYPVWVKDLVRVDHAIAQQSDNAFWQLGEDWFQQQARRFNVSVTYTLDGTSTAPSQVYVPPPLTGSVSDFPNFARWYLFHSGAWAFLDAGELNLGLVRDSTLNSTNDAQMFSETFEGAAFTGVESWVINQGVCANGERSAPADYGTICDGAFYAS